MKIRHGRLESEERQAMQVLTFVLGGDAFGIPIEQVREIIEFGGLTPVPTMPPYLRGVISLRGAVVPVVDLQVRFGQAETAFARRTCVVIVETRRNDSDRVLGVLVDAVNEVLTVDRGRLEPRPSLGEGLRSEFVRGILNLEDRLVVALDIDRILSDEEMDGLAAFTAGEPR